MGTRLALVSIALLFGCGGRIAVSPDDPGTYPIVDAQAPEAAVGARDARAPASDATAIDSSLADDAASDVGVVTGPSSDAGAPATDGAIEDAADATIDDAAPPCDLGTHFEAGGCLPDDPIAALPSTAPCLSPGISAMRIDADDDNGMKGSADHTLYEARNWWQNWQTDVSQAWNVGPYEYISVFNTIDSRTSDYVGWNLYFQTPKEDFKVGTYAPATSPVSSNGTQGVPQIELGYDVLGVPGTGAFRVDEFSHNGGQLLLLTMSFWAHADGHRGLVRGCVHYQVTPVADSGP